MKFVVCISLGGRFESSAQIELPTNFGGLRMQINSLKSQFHFRLQNIIECKRDSVNILAFVVAKTICDGIKILTTSEANEKVDRIWCECIYLSACWMWRSKYINANLSENQADKSVQWLCFKILNELIISNTIFIPKSTKKPAKIALTKFSNH